MRGRLNSGAKTQSRVGVALALMWALSGAALSAPFVSSFSPALGPPGTQVTVLGSGFGSATRVQFDDAVADFSALADNRLVAVVPPDATTGRIRVVSPGGTASSGTDFGVSPRITGFSPPRSATNTYVTINGYNFIGATNVQFAGRSGAFAVTAATQIQATVPAGVSNGLIRVATPAGAAFSAEEFVVTGPAPIIDSFDPPIGQPGTEVLIYGANFTNVTAVKFNTANATTFVAPAHTQLRALVPSGASTGKITVTTPGGTTTSTNDFIVSGAPFITSFTPLNGRDDYTWVTIRGLNFMGVTGVGFNGKAVRGIATPAPGQIDVQVPAGATTGPITVTNAAGVGVSTRDFVITLAPIIDYFSPLQGAEGTQVTIGGINLSNGYTVLKFNGIQAPFRVTGQGGTQISATVPTGAKSGPITMTNSYGSFITATDFFVTGSAPYVSSLSPESGARGTLVVITGGGFTAPATVKFNGVTDPTAAVTALTQIHATVPPGALSGPVTVTTSAGTSTNTVVFHAPPRLTSIAPVAGVVGDRVTLMGTNFLDTTAVWFNGLASDYEIEASNRVVAVVPADARTGPVTVTTPGGVIISPDPFAVLPRIDSFSPRLGPVDTVVTVRGTTFHNVRDVSFDTVSARFTIVSAEELQTTVPGAAVTGPIRLATPDGSAVSTESFLVTRSSDLGLTKTASASLVAPGEILHYTVVASNLGPSVVTEVQITDALPVGIEFVDVVSDLGSATYTNGVVTGSLAALTNGMAVRLEITALVREQGLITNWASVKAVESDPAPGNNQDQASVVALTDASRTLFIDRTGDFVVLRWPVSPVALTLQSTEPIGRTNIWSTVSIPPAAVQGWNVVTNQTAQEEYYRLRGP